jgi:hypothetical protein
LPLNVRFEASPSESAPVRRASIITLGPVRVELIFLQLKVFSHTITFSQLKCRNSVNLFSLSVFGLPEFSRNRLNSAAEKAPKTGQFFSSFYLLKM